jgi:hypothetical protein
MMDRIEKARPEMAPKDLSSNMNFIAPSCNRDYTAAAEKFVQRGSETNGVG